MIEELARTPIGEIGHREVARVPPETPLLEVVTTLKEHKRGAVLVEDSTGLLVGIFTERDLMKRVDHGNHDWHTETVGKVMTASPKTIASREPVAAAIRRMRRGRFRHLPIVNKHGRGVGIISIRDILAHIAEHYPQEFLNLPPDPDREATSRWGG
jgi:CBS domain-containing protein